MEVSPCLWSDHMNTQRIVGLSILIASMTVFGLGTTALPSANQFVAVDVPWKTHAFIFGGIASMLVGATMACFAKKRKECVPVGTR